MDTYIIQTDAWWNSYGGSNIRNLAYDTNRERYWAVYRHQVGSDFGIYAAYSDDNGVTWIEEEIVIISGSAQSDCTLAIDSQGNLHVVVAGLGHGTYTSKIQVVYYERSASTNTWATKVLLTNEDNHHCNPTIGIDGTDNLHVVWIKDLYAYVMYRKRISGSWGTTEEIASGLGTSDLMYGQPSLAVASDGTAHVVWYQRANYILQIHYRERSSASSWGTIVELTSNARSQTHPCIALDSEGEPHVIWTGEGWGTEIYYENPIYRYRLSGVWQTAEALLDAATDYSCASIAVDTNGDVHAIFFKSATGTYHIAKISGSWGAVTFLSTGQNGTLLWGLNNIPTEGYGFGDYLAGTQAVRFNIEGMTFASIYPTDAITRVTGIIHRYNREQQTYSMELNLGDVTTDFGLPEWLSAPQVAVPSGVAPYVRPEEPPIAPPPTGPIQFEPYVPSEPYWTSGRATAPYDPSMAEGLSFWQRIGRFFTGLFGGS